MRKLGLTLTVASLVCAGVELGIWGATGSVSDLMVGVFAGLVASYGFWVWRKTA